MRRIIGKISGTGHESKDPRRKQSLAAGDLLAAPGCRYGCGCLVLRRGLARSLTAKTHRTVRADRIRAHLDERIHISVHGVSLLLMSVNMPRAGQARTADAY